MQRCSVLFSILAIGCLMLAVPQTAQAQCTLPYTLTNGQPADGAKLMANFNALAACINPGGSTNAVQYNAGSGALGGVGPLADGQLVIGSTGNAPQAQALMAGSGIGITNAPGAVTIAATGTGAGLYRQNMSATPTAANTGLLNWLNQGTATAADSAVGLAIDAPSTGAATNLTGRFKAAPTPPYAIRILAAATRNSNSFSEVGIGWYDGSAKLHLFAITTNGGAANTLTVTRWNSVTSFNNSDFSAAANAYSQPIWFEIKDDGTNVSFGFSQDGANFLPVYSVAKASGFLGATGYSSVVFFVDARGASHTLATLMSWTQN
jgi:hypothetical protein